MTATDERAAGRADEVTRTTTAAGLVVDIVVPLIRVTGAGLTDEKGAAEYLGKSVRTLQRYRAQNCGPAFHDQHGRIWYAIADLDAYLADSRVDPLGR